MALRQEAVLTLRVLVGSSSRAPLIVALLALYLLIRLAVVYTKGLLLSDIMQVP
jgi:hypothetical protein